jgi:hypothetical protein
MHCKIAAKTAAMAVALGAMTSVAWAEPMKLTDVQMDQVAAGEWLQYTRPTWLSVGPTLLLLMPGSYWFDPDGNVPPNYRGRTPVGPLATITSVGGP